MISPAKIVNVMFVAEAYAFDDAWRPLLGICSVILQNSVY
jgi:hypothetical protein